MRNSILYNRKDQEKGKEMEVEQKTTMLSITAGY
jgi:hypothetical protein